MNMPPPNHGYAQAPYAGLPQSQPYPPPPYPHGHVAPPRKSRAGLLIFSIFVAMVIVIMALLFISDRAREKANYLAFRGDGALHARVDGKDRGALAKPRTSSMNMTKAEGVTTEALVVELTPKEHQIEIVDANGAVVESVKVTVPERGYRALYAVGKPSGFAVYNVFYGSRGARTEVTPMHASAPHIFVAGPEAIELDDLEMSYVDQPFPKALYVKSSARPMLRRICAQDEHGETTCL